MRQVHLPGCIPGLHPRALQVDLLDCSCDQYAVVVLQVDLSDCDELGDAIFQCLSDGRRGLPGYVLDGGSPSLRYLFFWSHCILLGATAYLLYPTVPYRTLPLYILQPHSLCCDKCTSTMVCIMV